MRRKRVTRRATSAIALVKHPKGRPRQMTTTKPTTLAEAIVSRDIPTLRDAVSNGADPNARVHGTPLLVLAVIAGSIDAVEVLLRGGADPNARDRAGRAPLHYAALGAPDADPGLASSLISSGADVDARDSRESTPLDLASGAGNKQTASELIGAGATCREDRKGWVRQLKGARHSVGPRGAP